MKIILIRFMRCINQNSVKTFPHLSHEMSRGSSVARVVNALSSRNFPIVVLSGTSRIRVACPHCDGGGSTSLTADE